LESPPTGLGSDPTGVGVTYNFQQENPYIDKVADYNPGKAPAGNGDGTRGGSPTTMPAVHTQSQPVASDPSGGGILGDFEGFVGGGIGAAGTGISAVGSGITGVGSEAAEVAGDGTIDLYRTVGVREFEAVASSGKFLPGANSLEGRQFAFTLREALNYADMDLSKVAILKATVDSSALPAFDFSRAIDPFIFDNGVIAVQPGSQSDIFHAALRFIEHVF
jgi:hypothetical protein